MVAQLLRLKLQLLGNAFKRSPWQLVGLIIGLAYGAGVTVALVSSLIGLRFAPVPVATSAVTVFGSLLVLGFLAVPLVFGVDDVMAPRKFSLFGIPTSQLARALAVAALISIPSLVVMFLAVAQIVTWSRAPLPALLAILGAPVILITCVLGSRVSATVGAFLLATRRSRDATGVLAIACLLALAPVFLLLLNVNWQRDGLRVLQGISSVAGWTPLGAVWNAPADAAAGNPGTAWLRELVAVAFVLVLWVAWRYLVQALLVTQERAAQAKKYSGIGFFRFGGVSEAAVIAARSFTYWVRDARYHVSLLIIPIVPFVLVIPLMVAGVPTNLLALFPVPVMALFLGWSIHNDLAYDSTAFWLHVASGTRGLADRLGRIIPPLVLGVPVLVIAAIICAFLFGDVSILPGLIGAGLGMLFSGLGLSSIMSARFPYPAVRPGDSPFAQPQSAGTASSLIQSLSFVATGVLAAPTLVLAFLGVAYGPLWSWLALVVGLLLGGALLWVGVRWGGSIFDRRSPEILAFAVRN